MRISIFAAPFLVLHLLTACASGNVPDNKDQKMKDLVQSLEVGRYSPNEQDWSMNCGFVEGSGVKCVGASISEALCKSADLSLNQDALRLLSYGMKDVPTDLLNHALQNNGLRLLSKDFKPGPSEKSSQCILQINISATVFGTKYDKTMKKTVRDFVVSDEAGLKKVDIHGVSF